MASYFSHDSPNEGTLIENSRMKKQLFGIQQTWSLSPALPFIIYNWASASSPITLR